MDFFLTKFFFGPNTFSTKTTSMSTTTTTIKMDFDTVEINLVPLNSDTYQVIRTQSEEKLERLISEISVFR